MGDKGVLVALLEFPSKGADPFVILWYISVRMELYTRS